jgi:oxygen-dependent protoporphyrinogen oxidase
VIVVGGGIAGLAAARQLEARLPEADVVLVERDARLGGKLLTERDGGFVVEGAADSFLARKPRGVGLADELGLELVGRRPENARSFVRRGTELHRLPEGLTGVIPTNLDALAASELLSSEGKARLAAEVDVPPAPPGGDESIASFVTRRFGRETYERLVEPLMTGIYGGDGGRLSLQATFPNLRMLELEHGSVLRGLRAQPASPVTRPPFVSFRAGMGAFVDAISSALERTRVVTGTGAERVDSRGSGYAIALEDGDTLEADAAILAVPAFVAAELLAELDPELAQELAGIPYASSAIVTLAFAGENLPFDGYGYVVPSAEGSDVLACTWTTGKWEGRAPEGVALVRVYAGRFGGRDVTADTDADLVETALAELRFLGVSAEPARSWIHRWLRGMPQYVLGHLERLERIDAALARHPGLALAGAAYRGVGVPDCIHSGEEVARSLARSVAEARS